MKNLLWFILLSFPLFCSCSYRIFVEKDKKGKKHRIKDYKNYDIGVSHAQQAIFSRKNGYNTQQYPVCNGNYSFDTANSKVFIQYDSVRVYLTDTTKELKTTFQKGLLSPHIIYCCNDSTCRIIKERRIITRSTGEPIIYNRLGWGGPEITITNLELLKNVHSKGNQRRFSISLYFNDQGLITVFFLELFNDNANRRTDLDTFIKGAQVTFIKNGWVEI